MHRKVAGEKKKWISGTIAGVLTIAIVGGALYSSKGDAYARPSLVGVEAIVNDNAAVNPFTILEIVDGSTGYQDSRVGYFVAGEEPIETDKLGAYSGKSIYDMGSPEEAKVHIADTNFITNNVYSELKDYAFKHDSAYIFLNGSDRIGADAEGARLQNVYGRFEDNGGSQGRYNEADMSSIYVRIGDTSNPNVATIEEVESRNADKTDQSGIFYADYVLFNIDTNVGDTASNRVTIDLKKYNSATDPKQPFKSYSDGTVDYYSNYLYVTEKEFEYDEDVTDSDPTNHKYVLSASSDTPVENDIVFVNSAGSSDTLDFFGYFKKNSSDEIVFVDKNGTEKKVKDLQSNDSFAEDMKSAITGSKFYTVRDLSDGDGARDMYYIDASKVTVPISPAIGVFLYTLAEKLPVNEAGRSAESYNIVDESADGWYHTWWYKSGHQDPYVYVPDEDGAKDFKKDFTNGIINSFYYTGGIVNEELFKKWVLDVDAEQCGNIFVDVVTKKINEVSATDIENADLIVFDGNILSSNDDIGKEAAVKLVSEIGKNNKPVVVEAKMIINNYDVDSNLAKLCGIFTLPTMDGVEQYDNGSGDWSISAEAIAANKQRESKLYTQSLLGDVSYVTGSVFVNDDREGSGGTSNKVFGTGFTTKYADDVVKGFEIDDNGKKVSYGLTDVKNDIDEEKFYLTVAKKDVDKFNQEISKATCIRYILNYGNRRVVGKTAINVLDIEPFYNRELEESKNYDILSKGLNNNGGGRNGTAVDVTNIREIRDIFDVDWFNKNVISNKSDVQVTGMGVNEFVGKIEDINANYDLIYIGMDTAYMNTKIESEGGRWNTTYKKTKEVVGNTVTGYVYRHIGDTFTTDSLDGANNSAYYSSGLDITPDKLRELKSYVEAGYAVILSDEFFKYDANNKITGIDTLRVDPHSYMYDFVAWCWDEGKESGHIGKNVDTTRDFEVASNSATDKASSGRTIAEERENFVKYLNISKLQLNVISQPALYNKYDNSLEHEYLKMNNEGIYTLDFEIELTHDSAADTKETDYDCKLYIDHDGDGRFEDIEELDSLTIYNKNTGDDMNMENDKYHLKPGTTYVISRQVPEGYVGLISWKLVFYENNRTFTTDSNSLDNVVRVAVQDYSAISDRSNRPEIKILQLTSGNSDATNLDLKGDAILNEMYDQVNDFKITVEQDKVRNFIANDGTGNIFKGGDRLEALYNYDMLVLGFIDMYDFWHITGDDDAAFALREYMLSGRSVLFTHDLTSTRINSGNQGWGDRANRFLRDIQGMDRYNFAATNLAGKTYASRALTEYKSKYDDDANRLINGMDIYGFTDSELMRKNNSKYGLLARQDTLFTDADSNGRRILTSVARVNRGQITEYPFRIGELEQSAVDGNYYAGEIIPVASTHNQYYQLNLQTDYTDENTNDDVVVWYTLSAKADASQKLFALDYNDVANNYYIFSKGNVMYTGAGHSKIGGSEKDWSDASNTEKRLFVNTLVAAYNAGVHAPYASYKASAEKNAVEVKSISLPYDITLSKEDGENGLLGETVTVYFKTINNNLQDNKKVINTKYYVEMPSATGSTFQVGKKYYKEIEPFTFKNCTDSGKGDSVHALANAQVYQLEFKLTDLIGSADQVHDKLNPVIYTRMSTETSYADMNSKTKLDVLPALDSMSPIKINFTELFDLE